MRELRVTRQQEVHCGDHDAWDPGAAMTKDYTLGGWKQGHLFSHSSGSQQSKIKVLAEGFLVRAMRENQPSFW